MSLTPVETDRVETKWRRIATPIPAPGSLDVIRRLRAAEPKSMSGMPPILWDQAEGFLVRDSQGNQWIDLTSGILVANAGHSHPRIVQAVKDAAETGPLATYAHPHDRRLALLEYLNDRCDIDDCKTQLFSSGTEATECAIMLMRRHGMSIASEKTGIVSFSDGFHGRTLASVSASGNPSPQDWIPRETLHHYQIPFPYPPRWPWGSVADDLDGSKAFAECVRSLEDRGITPDMIAGFIGEPLPGWATCPIPQGFARALRGWCDEHQILLCFDEIQCGCGRTGQFFGHEHTGVTPDLLTLGKGLSSSLPVSALIGRRAILDVPAPGEMSSTHSGNPICSAAALANLEVLDDEKLIERANETGKRVLHELQKMQDDHPDRILAIHGHGLFISVSFKTPDSNEPDVDMGDAVAELAVRQGVLMFKTSRGFIKFTPPLNIDLDAALEAVEVIRSCVNLVVKNQTRGGMG